MTEQNWNLVSGTSSEWSDWITPTYNARNAQIELYTMKLPKFEVPQTFACQIEVEFSGVTATKGQKFRFSFPGAVNGKWTWQQSNPWLYVLYSSSTIIPSDGVMLVTWTRTIDSVPDTDIITCGLNIRCDYWASGKFRYRCVKIEYGDTATPWCGTFDEEREKAIAARKDTLNAPITLTALSASYSINTGFFNPSFGVDRASVPYINLQWNRSLYEAGSFEVQLDANDYSTDWAAFCVTYPNESYGGAQAGSYYSDNYPDKIDYDDSTRHGRICTATGHYEIGLIYKRRLITKSGQSYVLLSGLMMDSILDGWVSWTAQPQGVMSVQEALYNAVINSSSMRDMDYDWIHLKLALSTAEDKALAPTLTTKDYTPLYTTVNIGDHYRALLEHRNCGLAATGLWQKSQDGIGSFSSVFFVKAGVDRTLQGGSPVVIGCAFGNVASEDVTVDDSSLRVGITGVATYEEDGNTLYARWTSENQDTGSILNKHWQRGYLTETNFYTGQDITTKADAVAAAKAYGTNILQDYTEEATAELDVSLLDVDTFNSLGLGDLVTVYLDATNSFETMRIVGFSEVCKNGTCTRSITLGTKRLTNAVRAAKYAAL